MTSEKKKTTITLQVFPINENLLMSVTSRQLFRLSKGLRETLWMRPETPQAKKFKLDAEETS